MKSICEYSPSPSLNNGNKTCLTNDSKPLSVIFPGSQNARFNFFLTLAGESNKSILLSSSLEDIFPPANPGTINKIINKFSIQLKKLKLS